MGRSCIDGGAGVDVQALAGSFHLAAVAGSAAPACRDAAVELRDLVGPYRDIAAIAGVDGIGLDRRTRLDRGGVRILLGAGAEEIAADQRRTAAASARHINQTACRQCDGAAEHFHGAANGAGGDADSVERAAVGGRARAARPEHNSAADLLDTARLNNTRVVDHAGQHGIPGAGRQPDRAAVGIDQTAIFSQIVQGALVHLQLNQAIAGKRQRDVAARAQRHRPRPGVDRPRITDLVADEGNITAVAGIDGALVDDAAAARAAEIARSTIQAGVADIERRRHQAADVDLRSGAKQHAIRIDQINLAVGVECAVELGGAIAADAVDGNGAGRGLDKIDRLAAAGVERLPVQRQVLARLRHRGGGAVLVDGAVAGGNLAAGRPRHGRV